jgi:hypothetical protein
MTKTEEAIREQLRDKFATSALQGVLAREGNDGYPQDYAKWAYEYADAMLEARDK